MPASGSTDIPARHGGGNQHCHRLSIDGGMTYASWTSSGSSDSGSGVMSIAATGNENAYRDRLRDVDVSSAFAVDDIGGGGRRDSLSSSRSSSGSCCSCSCNVPSSGRYSTRTAAPSPDTSGSHGFVREYSPAGTPISTASSATGSLPLPSGRGGCWRLDIGGSRSGSPPRFSVDSPSGSCQTGPAAASTVAAEAAGLRRGRYVLSLTYGIGHGWRSAHSCTSRMPEANLATTDLPSLPHVSPQTFYGCRSNHFWQSGLSVTTSHRLRPANRTSSSTRRPHPSPWLEALNAVSPPFFSLWNVA